MSLRLSIIIPFYNVERYIAECLDSVYQQNIPEDEYEVICVNDGSSDHSRDIVNAYQTKHPNLLLVEHEENRKLGAARNTGRSVAKGDYIWNVDSDDKIVPNCLDYLLRICEENELDTLDFERFRFWEGECEEMPNAKLAEVVVSGLEYLEGLDSQELSRMCVAWRRVIRRAFLDDNRIFSPSINLGEDVPYSYKILMLSKRMMVIPQRCYFYRANPESLTGKLWRPTPKTLYEKCFEASRLIYEVAVQVPKKYAHVRDSYINTARFILRQYVQYETLLSPAERKDFRDLCRRAFIRDRFIKDLLPLKGYAKYVLRLWGILPISK